MNADEIKYRIDSIYKNKFSIGTAFNTARSKQSKDSLLLVYGSFYTVSEALSVYSISKK